MCHVIAMKDDSPCIPFKFSVELTMPQFLSPHHHSYALSWIPSGLLLKPKGGTQFCFHGSVSISDGIDLDLNFADLH